MPDGGFLNVRLFCAVCLRIDVCKCKYLCCCDEMQVCLLACRVNQYPSLTFRYVNLLFVSNRVGHECVGLMHFW